jgi:hypothetical protein
MLGLLPNFLIIGAMKAGTTSLYHYLKQHPQVFMSEPKELHFFVEELNWHQGWRWYQDHFAGAAGAVAIGEASASYAKYPIHADVPERISHFLPEVRLIYVVRQPIERIRSEYVHQVLMGRERDPIDRAVINNPQYVNHSRYSFQIEQYLRHFTSDQLLVITSEQLRSQRKETVQLVSAFIGVEEIADPAWLEHEYYRTDQRRDYNAIMRWLIAIAARRHLTRLIPRSVKDLLRRPVNRFVQLDQIRISEEVRQELEDMLRDDVRRLRMYVGEDFDGWDIG